MRPDHRDRVAGLRPFRERVVECARHDDVAVSVLVAHDGYQRFELTALQPVRLAGLHMRHGY
jgi:hypothetical protein